MIAMRLKQLCQTRPRRILEPRHLADKLLQVLHVPFFERLPRDAVSSPDRLLGAETLDVGGQKLSSGCIMVPHMQKEAIEKFFKKFKVKFEQLKVWK